MAAQQKMIALPEEVLAAVPGQMTSLTSLVAKNLELTRELKEEQGEKMYWKNVAPMGLPELKRVYGRVFPGDKPLTGPRLKEQYQKRICTRYMDANHTMKFDLHNE